VLVGGAIVWAIAAIQLLVGSPYDLFSESTWISIGNAAEHIILLKWVSKYQTLLSGFCAIAAGVWVYWSAKIQIEHQVENTNKAEVRELRNKYVFFDNCLRTILLELLANRYPDMQIDMAKEFIKNNNISDGRMSYLLQIILSRLDDVKKDFKFMDLKETDSIRDALVLVSVSADVFREYARRVGSLKTLADYGSVRGDMPIDIAQDASDGLDYPWQSIAVLKLFFKDGSKA